MPKKNDLKSENGIEFDVDIENSNDDIKKVLDIDNDINFEKYLVKHIWIIINL